MISMEGGVGVILTITLENGNIIETDNLSLIKEAPNGDEFKNKLNSDDYFTVLDIYGEKYTEKWSLIDNINIKF